MTEIGLCHNATWPNSRLSVGAAKRYRPRHARTITYWRDDASSWHETLAACRDLAELGVKNLVLFNTEAFGGRLIDLDLLQERLHAFLMLAREEYSYVDPDSLEWTSPVHSIEPLNEIDTPGWHDGAFEPITPQKVLDYTFATHAVATDMFHLETVSPSFLGGPLSELPVAVLSELARDGHVQVASFHMYGRSIMGQPSPGWIHGTVEQGVDELLQYIGDMQIDLTEGGCWTVAGEFGAEGQQRFVEAHNAFEHPRVRRNYLFAFNDWCCGDKELEAGKDFGLEGLDGLPKPAASVFNGGLVIRKAEPTPDTPGPDFTYILGFRDFHSVLTGGGVHPGRPLENEWQAWDHHVLQRAEHGLFDWFRGPDDGRLTYLHEDGRRFRWDKKWPTFHEISDGNALSVRHERSPGYDSTNGPSRPQRLAPAPAPVAPVLQTGAPAGAFATPGPNAKPARQPTSRPPRPGRTSPTM